MKLKTIILAVALALTTTFAVAQNAGSTAAGSSKAGGTGGYLARLSQGWARLCGYEGDIIAIGCHHHRM